MIDLERTSRADCATKWVPTLRARAIVLAPGTVFMGLFVWRCGANPYGGRRFTLFDDAMISMTYGRTLARTGELVWFPGADRVQGVTNPLWTMYMALLHVAGFEGSGAALAVSLTSLLLILATAAMVGDVVLCSLSGSRRSATTSLAASAIVPWLYPLVYWSLRGMEVGVLACALLVLVWALARIHDAERGAGLGRPTAVSVVAIVLGVATRLDFAPLALVAVGCAGWSLRDNALARRAVRIAGGAVVVAVALVLAAQRYYFGDALPNTYRLKVDGFSIFERLHRGLFAAGKLGPVLVLVTVACVVALARGTSRTRQVVVSSGVLLVAATGYSCWVGGDAWEANLLLNRYVSVVLPLVVVAVLVAAGLVLEHATAPSRRQLTTVIALVVVSGAAVGLRTNPFGYDVGASIRVAIFVAIFGVVGAVLLRRGRNELRSGRTLVGLVSVVAVGVVGGAPLIDWIDAGAAYSDIDQMQTSYGQAMNRLTTPEAVIGTVWAGAPAYYAERPMVDFLGKSDATIAGVDPRGPLHPGHNKWDHDYSIGTLLPRVALQLWASDGESLHMIGVEGYYFRCFDLGDRVGGAYMRLGSQIDETQLTICNGIPG